MSLSDIIAAAQEQIKGYVLKVLKEFQAVETLKFYGAFRQRWKQGEPAMVSLLERYFPLTIAYYGCPRQWRHRVRTTNIAKCFFRNLWRFMGSFPGFQDEEHGCRVSGTYLLGGERYKKAQEILPYALKKKFQHKSFTEPLIFLS